MPSRFDRDYYEQRLREERERARGADPVAARVHAELAEAYEKLLGSQDHQAMAA